MINNFGYNSWCTNPPTKKIVFNYPPGETNSKQQMPLETNGCFRWKFIKGASWPSTPSINPEKTHQKHFDRLEGLNIFDTQTAKGFLVCFIALLCCWMIFRISSSQVGAPCMDRPLEGRRKLDWKHHLMEQETWFPNLQGRICSILNVSGVYLQLPTETKEKTEMKLTWH